MSAQTEQVSMWRGGRDIRSCDRCGRRVQRKVRGPFTCQDCQSVEAEITRLEASARECAGRHTERGTA